MEKGDPVMIVSDNDSLRDAAWEYFSNIGYSCNFERDLEGALKRISDGIFKIVVVDIDTTIARKSPRINAGYKEGLWLQLQEKCRNFKNQLVPDLVDPAKRGEIIIKSQFIESLDEIVQAYFLS